MHLEVECSTWNDMEDSVTSTSRAVGMVSTRYAARAIVRRLLQETVGPRNKQALPFLALGGAALAFGRASTLFGWLGMKGTTRVQNQLFNIQHRQDVIIKAAWETGRQVGLLCKEIMDMLLSNAINNQFDTVVLLALLQTYFSQLETKVSQQEHLFLFLIINNLIFSVSRLLIEAH